MQYKQSTIPLNDLTGGELCNTLFQAMKSLCSHSLGLHYELDPFDTMSGIVRCLE